VTAFSLTIREGPTQGTQIALEGEVVVGRMGTTVEIPDPEISRRHAVFRLRGEALEVDDLDSLNGTFVNGERISAPTVVRGGDRVRVGDTELEVVAERDPRVTVVSSTAAAPAPVPPPAAAAPSAPPSAPFSPPQVRRRRAAATRLAAPAVATFAAIAATAAALIVYFATR
jgi:hypothetical protein